MSDELMPKLDGVTFYEAGNTEPSGHAPIRLPENAGIGDVITIQIRRSRRP